MLKFLKVTYAPKAIALGRELPPKPCEKRLVVPKKEEPSCDANLFSQQLWKLYGVLPRKGGLGAPPK